MKPSYSYRECMCRMERTHFVRKLLIRGFIFDLAPYISSNLMSVCSKVDVKYCLSQKFFWYPIWASAWDYQQCGMCDQQRLRSACAYAQFDQKFCSSLEYFMSVKLLTEHLLEVLSLKGGCTGLPESTLVKLLEITCWAHLIFRCPI